jgi:hypothetical protein
MATSRVRHRRRIPHLAGFFRTLGGHSQPDLPDRELPGQEPEDGSPAELEVETWLLLLFHRLRGEFRDFVEIRLRDVELLNP